VSLLTALSSYPERLSTSRAPLYLISSKGDGDDIAQPLPFDPVPNQQEDLSYKIELWDTAKLHVEQILALTANGSIGYAAYFAATREFPERHITLRHNGKILSSWNGSEQ
jgi:hypothetical protein